MKTFLTLSGLWLSGVAFGLATALVIQALEWRRERDILRAMDNGGRDERAFAE